MTERTIELKIDKLAGLGDGVGHHEGKKIFVPHTTAGDVVRAVITRETADATYAAITEILTPGKDRIAPACRHFSTCGGCALQHIAASTYRNFKQSMAQEAVRKAGFDISVEDIIALPAASRRRIELKAGNGKIGFYEERSRNLVNIEDCRIMEPELLALVMDIKKQLSSLPVKTIQMNGVDDGYDILLEGTGDIKWQPDNRKIKRISIRNGDKIKTIYQPGDVTLSLGNVKIDISPGAFLQASRAAQSIMTSLVKNAVGNCCNVLDLFAGIGTYSFPVAADTRVTAIEGDKTMVAAMQNTAQKYKIAHFKATQRDLFSQPFTPTELTPYDAAIINPPRPGAKAQSEQLAKSPVKKMVMVSCNPATFSRDARILKEGGYALQKLTPIDQFVYSPHLELVAEFMK